MSTENVSTIRILTALDKLDQKLSGEITSLKQQFGGLGTGFDNLQTEFNDIRDEVDFISRHVASLSIAMTNVVTKDELKEELKQAMSAMGTRLINYMEQFIAPFRKHDDARLEGFHH